MNYILLRDIYGIDSNRILLKSFAIHFYHYCSGVIDKQVMEKNGIEYSQDLQSNIEKIIDLFATNKELRSFSDNFAIGYAKWLNNRLPRTLEHTDEELIAEYHEYLLNPNNI